MPLIFFPIRLERKIQAGIGDTDPIPILCADTEWVMSTKSQEQTNDGTTLLSESYLDSTMYSLSKYPTLKIYKYF